MKKPNVPFSLRTVAPPALALAMLLLAPMADAGVYKGIGPDGRIFYSDQPIDGAAPVELPADVQPAATDEAQSTDEEPGADDATPTLGPYNSLEIITPTEGETVRTPERSLPVSLLLEPALAEGNRISIEINGVPVKGADGRSTQVQLGDLPLGSHQLQVRVLDADGNALARSEVVHFHVRRPLPDAALP
jgi:hypothetical protein